MQKDGIGVGAQQEHHWSFFTQQEYAGVCDEFSLFSVGPAAIINVIVQGYRFPENFANIVSVKGYRHPIASNFFNEISTKEVKSAPPAFCNYHSCCTGKMLMREMPNGRFFFRCGNRLSYLCSRVCHNRST